MNSIRFLALSLIFAVGFAVTAPAPPTTATMCFRGRTIVVPFYLRNGYIAAGAIDGTCGQSF